MANIVKKDEGSVYNLLAPQTLEQAQQQIVIYKRELGYFRGLSGNLFNERAAMFRGNHKPGSFGSSQLNRQIELELRVIENAFKIAKLVPWRNEQDPNDPCVMFHLSIRNLIEIRCSCKLHFTKEDALNDGYKAERSYEHLYTQEGFEAPKPIL